MIKTLLLSILLLVAPNTPTGIGVTGFKQNSLCPSNIPESIGFYVRDSQYDDLTCEETFELTRDNPDLYFNQSYSDYDPIPERKVRCHVSVFCVGWL